MNKEQLTQFNRGQSSKIFKRVKDSGEPILVMQHSKALVVILSAEKYVELTNEPLKVDIPLNDLIIGEKNDR